MTNTAISGAPHGTPPINPASRVPIADPAQVGVKLSAGAREIAATISPVIVTLTSLGITSDATNGLAYGAAPPAGATGQEAAINAALAAAWTASAGRGLCVVWDVAVALGGPIYYPGSFTEIWAPSKACGAILRANAACPIFRAPGTNADMTNSTNTQKTFGKFDPGAPGGSHNYRIFDPSFVNAQRLALRGGTWNGNYPNQGGTLVNNTAYGWISLFQFWGVDGLKVFDIDIILNTLYGVHALNCRNFEYGGILVDTSSSAIGSDGVHVNGPSIGVRGGHIRYHGGDDNIAFNADDGENAENYVAGINAQCGGDISDIVAEGADIWEGTQNTSSVSSVRFLSNYHRIDNAKIINTAGVNSTLALWIIPWSTPLCAGSGNFGHIIIEDDTHDTVNISLGTGVFAIGGVCDFIEIRGRYRRNATAYPDIYIQTNAVIARMEVESFSYQPSGASQNTQAAMLIAGAIARLGFRGGKQLASSIGTQNSPLIRTATGANITMLIMDADGDYITNMIDHAAGTIGTVKFNGGVHSNAGGGSPLAIASGLTITNVLSGTGGGPLAFKTGTAVKSGAGAITNQDSYSGP